MTKCDEASLRAALEGGGSVTFACNGTIVLGSTVVISNNTILDGTGHAVTLSGGDQVGIIEVEANITATFISLGISNGRLTNRPGLGAGILNMSGQVNLTNCQLNYHMTAGADGGQYIFYGNPGYAAYGGAIYNGGQLNVDSCFFYGNTAAAGRGGDGASANAGGNGGNASGGAIYNAGTLRVLRTSFTYNITSGGNGGSSTGYPNSYTHPDGGSGGSGGAALGGAIFNAGSAYIEQVLFNNNECAGGNGGLGDDGAPATAPYNGGNGGAGGNGGGALGAGLYAGSAAGVTNCTFAYNSASGGNGAIAGSGGSARTSSPLACGGNGGNGGGGGNAVGAGVFAQQGSIAFCTFSVNSAAGGSGTNGGSGGDTRGSCFGTTGTTGPAGLTAGTGAAADSSGNIRSVNCLFASGSGGSNFFGSVVDLGNNLSSDASPPWTTGTSRNNLNPGIGVLQNNGGPTLSIPLNAGSPAINAGAMIPGVIVDQRGYLRQFGSAPDIGAYEWNASPLATTFNLSRPTLSNGVMWVQVTGPPLSQVRFQRSPNLKNWSDVSTNTTDGLGIAAFGDTTPPVYRLYYRTVSP